MSVTSVNGNNIQATLAGGMISAFSMIVGSLCANSSMKACRVAEKSLQQREVDNLKVQTLSNKLIVLWGLSGVMEWVSHIPGSMFAASKLFFSVFGRSISCALSLLRLQSTLRDLVHYEKLAQLGSKIAAHLTRVAICNLLAELCFLAYFALELAALLLGFAIAAKLTTLLVLSGIAFLMVGIIYLCVSGAASQEKKVIEA